ncbi:MAG: tRNA pseudouridine(38-40) synthase TruA [Myxococcales bacterium]|nr:tRNA pseudouridine(38-40) synthase TruA [Myxococcales bacterium]
MSRTPSRLVAMWCWYHGAPYRGYQAQALGPTVQQTLLDAMARIGLHRNVVASGRTDAGVHARMQVLSFRLEGELPVEELPARINAHLPPTLGVALVRQAPPHFNAHWRSSMKEYRYRLLVGANERWAPVAWAVDVTPEAISEVLQVAVGAHDFSAFHAKRSAVRERVIESVEVVEPSPGLLDVRVRGDRFGKYMVRSLIGGAVAVASGAWSKEEFAEALARGSTADPEGPEQTRRRLGHGDRAPAAGLVLWSVEYPPADDPFTAQERREAREVPRGPPFSTD